MKEINLNFFFKGLDGKDIKENAGLFIAKALSTSASKNPVKFWAWANEFHSGQTVKMDADDIKLLADFVKDHEVITVLAKAQILEVLNK